MRHPVKDAFFIVFFLSIIARSSSFGSVAPMNFPHKPSRRGGTIYSFASLSGSQKDGDTSIINF